MLVDIKTAAVLDNRAFPSLPVFSCEPDMIWKAGDAEIRLLASPSTVSDDAPVFIKFAMLALYKGRVKYCVSFEMEDLRILASKLFISEKVLQREYNTKSHFVSPRIYAYAEDEREEYGATGDMKKEEAVIILMDMLLDAIDSPDDPVRVK